MAEICFCSLSVGVSLGPVSEQEQERARRVFDKVFAEEGQWPAAS